MKYRRPTYFVMQHEKCRLSFLMSLGVYSALSALFCSNFFSWSNLYSSNIQAGDSALNAWALQWGAYSLTHNPFQLFHGNAFHPHPNSIALSEHLFSLVIINVLFRLYSTNPWFGFNLVIFLAYVLSSCGAYLLISHLTHSRLASFWGGIFWGFLFFRIHHIGHIQIHSFQWFPFCILFLLKFFEHPTYRAAFLLTGFFLLQALTSWYLAVIISAALAVVACCHLHRGLLTHQAAQAGLLCLFFTGLCLLPFASPYLLDTAQTSTLSARMESSQALSDQVHLKDYLIPPYATLAGQYFETKEYWIWEENTLYIGYVPLLLCGGYMLWWLWAFLRRQRSVNGQENRLLLSSLALGAVGYVCAKGFVSHAWGLKLPLYYLAEFVPFIGGLRATQRFSILIYLAVLILSGLALARLLRTIPQTGWQVVVTGLCTSIFLLEVYPYKLPINAADPFAFSAVDQKIAVLQMQHNKPLVVLHLPIYHFLETYPISEAKYMVDSTLHWARIVNGFSGTYPHGFMADMELLYQLPAPAARKKLAEFEVGIIGVHPATPAAQKTALLQYYQTLPLAQIIPVQPDAYLIFLSK